MWTLFTNLTATRKRMYGESWVWMRDETGRIGNFEESANSLSMQIVVSKNCFLTLYNDLYGTRSDRTP